MRVIYSLTLTAEEAALADSRQRAGESRSKTLRRLVLLGAIADIRQEQKAKKAEGEEQ